MGHTLPTVTGHFDRFRSQLSDFRRVLRKSDQIAFDALLNEARQHLPAAGFASHVLPEIMFLFCLFLEEHKHAKHLEAELDSLRSDFQREVKKLQHEMALGSRAISAKKLLEVNAHIKSER